MLEDSAKNTTYLGGRFGYFLFFSAWGGGRGVRGVGRGIFIENPRRGGGVLQEGEGPRGREGVCGELGNLKGGGGGG